MKGVVYKYTSPNGKIYIGQTIDEIGRRHSFMHKTHYAGNKMDRARKKYGPENFKYEVLMEFIGEKDRLISILNKLETAYIEYYDSVNNGYNSNYGGDNHSPDIDTRKRISKKLKDSGRFSGKNNPNYGKHHSEETRKRMSDNRTNKRPILQLDVNNNLIREYTSISEANKLYNYDCAYIQRCCKHRKKLAYGYKWKYKYEDK